jgi:chromosome partitioning protein
MRTCTQLSDTINDIARPAVKGGSGKTTLAFCCAVAAQEKEKRTLLLDMDPQGTATAWFKDRESATPALATIKSSELRDAINKAEKAGFDLILIDTPGRDEPATAAAIRAADLCIIPCRPTPGDMKATPPTIATINRLKKDAAFILTQTPPRSYRNSEAEKGLSMMGMSARILLSSAIPTRMRRAGA